MYCKIDWLIDGSMLYMLNIQWTAVQSQSWQEQVYKDKFVFRLKNKLVHGVRYTMGGHLDCHNKGDVIGRVRKVATIAYYQLPFLK